jgi:FkbM family methyltransferase
MHKLKRTILLTPNLILKTPIFFTCLTVATITLLASFVSKSQNTTEINESQDRLINELSQSFEKLGKTLSQRIERLEKELEKKIESEKVYLKLYDFSREKLPPDEKFDCVRMANIVVEPILCIHDLSRDMYVSTSIKSNGVWERSLVEFLMKVLQSNPAFQFLDIGAQLGQFTMYAAKLGRTSVAVEPFYDNYIRLHASALHDNLTSKIILVNNGISDRRGDIKQLRRNNSNIGGQGIKDSDELNEKKNISDVAKNDKKYLLVTITLDDLVPVLPDHFNKAIMKIDIEGYEFKAFRRAIKLLKRVEVPVILMEWLGKSDTARFSTQEVDQFFNFMISLGYVSRSLSNLVELSTQNHGGWPTDVVFVLDSYYPTLKKLFE